MDMNKLNYKAVISGLVDISDVGIYGIDSIHQAESAVMVLQRLGRFIQRITEKIFYLRYNAYSCRIPQMIIDRMLHNPMKLKEDLQDIQNKLRNDINDYIVKHFDDDDESIKNLIKVLNATVV